MSCTKKEEFYADQAAQGELKAWSLMLSGAQSDEV